MLSEKLEHVGRSTAFDCSVAGFGTDSLLPCRVGQVMSVLDLTRGSQVLCRCTQAPD